METTEITAGRLHLRPWVAYDADAVLAAWQDPLIHRFTSIGPSTMADVRAFVEERSPQRWEAGTAASFAVLDATTGELLSGVTLFGLAEEHRHGEIGYWTVPAARGQGITAEAVGTVCRWGFAVLDVHRIACLTAPENVASQRTALRAGFTYEGIARGRLTRDGAPLDAWQAARLATDPASPT